MQKWILRTISFKPPSFSSRTLFPELNVLSFYLLFIFFSILHVQTNLLAFPLIEITFDAITYETAEILMCQSVIWGGLRGVHWFSLNFTIDFQFTWKKFIKTLKLLNRNLLLRKAFYSIQEYFNCFFHPKQNYFL